MRVGLDQHVLGPGVAHVWQIPLVLEEPAVQRCRQALSSDEIQRADRFHFARDRVRFVAAHAAMREILAGYVNSAPQDLTFVTGDRGKPALASGGKGFQVEFNLSHSGDFAVLAIAKSMVLGVDIERINPEFASEQIAERFFAPIEVDHLRSLPPAAQAEAFFSCWTRKEAYIKAVGEGLSIPLDSFAVAFGPGVSPRLLQVDAQLDEISRWSMYDLQAPGGYKAALVIEGQGHHLLQKPWKAGCVSRD